MYHHDELFYPLEEDIVTVGLCVKQWMVVRVAHQLRLCPLVDMHGLREVHANVCIVLPWLGLLFFDFHIVSEIAEIKKGELRGCSE